MIDSELIRQSIRQFVIQNFILEDGAGLADDASLVEEGIIDSTGILELVLFLEEKFGLSVPDQDITPENLDSIQRLETYVARRLAEQLISNPQGTCVPVEAV